MRYYLFILLALLSSCMPSWPPESLRNHEEIQNSYSQIEEKSLLKIYFPYIGQGDSTLIILPNGKSLLIDAGTATAGKDWLLPFLQDLSISEIDTAIITHYDSDHLGGISTMLDGQDQIRGSEDDIHLLTGVDRMGTPWDPSPALNSMLEALDYYQIPRSAIKPGDEIQLDPEVQIRCIAVDAKVINPDETIQQLDLSPETYSGRENAASIVLLIRYKNFTYLTGGDLTGGGVSNGFLTPDLESLVAKAVGNVDVVHANHHGSLSSSNQQFIEATQPQAVMIQAGINNPYGHPHPNVIERWQSIGAEIYSTENGDSFFLTTDGEEFKIEKLD